MNINTKHIYFIEFIIVLNFIALITFSLFDKKTCPQLSPIAGVTGYTTDCRSIYFNNAIVKDADVQSFEALGVSSNYAKDKKHIFYGGVSLKEVIDPNSFWDIMSPSGSPSLYATDNNYIYCNGIVLRGADAKNFVVNSYTAQDSKNVYYSCARVLGADASSFQEILNSSYEKDSKSVYYNGNIIQGADVNTFVVDATHVGVYDAKDKNNKYSYGQIIIVK